MSLYLGLYSQLGNATPAALLERALALAYKPILTHLYKNSSFACHLYLAGPILDWLENTHPEVNMLIADLCKKEQVELLTGTFSQQFVHLYPNKYRSMQIEEMTTYLRKRFAKRARTIWLYNQAWSAQSISTLRLCSIDRVIISSFDHRRQINGPSEPFVMQEMDKRVEIFPTCEKINSLIAELAQGKISQKHFLEALEEYKTAPRSDVTTIMINLDQLIMAHECGHSSLTPLEIFLEISSAFGEQESQLLGSQEVGNIQNFHYLASGWYGQDSCTTELSHVNEMLLRYPELNHLYGKILYTAELIRLYRKGRDFKKRIESFLLKAMSGSSFVFDPSGGIYRPSYRKYAYKQLNEIEKILSTSEELSYPHRYELSMNGCAHFFFKGKKISATFNPKGGTLTDIVYVPTGWNYGDTFTGYQSECERLTLTNVPDGTFQNSFNDLFLASDVNLEAFDKSDTNSCFDTQSFTYTVNEESKSANEIISSYTFTDIPFHIGSIQVEKRFLFRLHAIVVEYRLTNVGDSTARGKFATELNLSVGTKDQHVQLYTTEGGRSRNFPLGKAHIPKVKNFRISDDINRTFLVIAAKERFSLCKEDALIRLETIAGSEVLYQYTTMVPIWPFTLKPNESLEATLGFRLERKASSKRT